MPPVGEFAIIRCTVAISLVGVAPLLRLASAPFAAAKAGSLILFVCFVPALVEYTGAAFELVLAKTFPAEGAIKSIRQQEYSK